MNSETLSFLLHTRTKRRKTVVVEWGQKEQDLAENGTRQAKYKS
jgi:hypothetical protein